MPKIKVKIKKPIPLEPLKGDKMKDYEWIWCSLMSELISRDTDSAIKIKELLDIMRIIEEADNAKA